MYVCVPAIGIHHGTTYSCVGVWLDDRVEIIANDQGNRTTPSYVAFTNSERLIGDPAKNQVAMNPINIVFDISKGVLRLRILLKIISSWLISFEGSSLIHITNITRDEINEVRELWAGHFMENYF
ncbi:hypothetical protein RND81_02G148200 [Saponaria officinalis]|uniref:Uncharacterized protein n=1 Tax=Saponaria officinalis TaxID=3572 RepID=A0AAW1MUD7_SAPOF